MIFDWTATHDEDGTEFGGTVDAEPDNGDYRPVFALALELAVEHYPDFNVTVTAISWMS